MEKDVAKMHLVWDGLLIEQRSRTHLPSLNFDEIISSIFTTGPFYYYVIDFYDMSISNVSSGIKEAHGVSPGEIHHINDILAFIHPDDVEHVTSTEKKSYELIYNQLGVDKITRYKVSYNFRFRTADGNYRLYNHQALVLTVDENGNFIKSLNIHTDISHITKKNNFKFSLIGLAGEPSFLNLDVHEDLAAEHEPACDHVFTKREIEVLKLLAKGATSKEISEALYISLETVKSHRKNLLAKSGCRNFTELAARSLSEGWI